MSWFWMNMPLAALFFIAWAGIPLYMILRRPNWSVVPAEIAHYAPAEAPEIEKIHELAGAAH